MRQASDTGVSDTTSGFRAYNREAAIQMAVVSKFTYTLETIIQAGKLLVATEDVPIRTNPKTRESRLFPSTSAYVRRNTVSIARIYAQYEPLRVFMTIAAVLFVLALIPWVRFAIVAWIQGDGAGHVQSLILGAVLFNAAVVMAALGVLGDLLYGQRIMIQRVFERVRRIELQLEIPPSHYEPGRSARARARRRPAPTPPRRPRSSASPRRSRRRSGCEHQRHGRPRRHGHRQHLRQVRLDEPGRPAPDDAASTRASTSSATRPRRARSSTSAAARACSRTSGRRSSRAGASSASTSTTRSSTSSWDERTAPNLEYRVMKAENLPFADDEFELASAIEVLEHVPDPAGTVAEMARCASRWLLVSVPREPVWRMVNMARGAYWKDLGNTPGHVNHWSKRSFTRMLSRARHGHRGPLAVPVDDVPRPRRRLTAPHPPPRQA